MDEMSTGSHGISLFLLFVFPSFALAWSFWAGLAFVFSSFVEDGNLYRVVLLYYFEVGLYV